MVTWLIKQNGWFAMAVTVLIFGGMTSPVLAQQEGASEANQQNPKPPPPIRHDRTYAVDRARSLSRHRRFDQSDIPPGYSPYTWYQEMAASNAYDRGYDEGFRNGYRAAQQSQAEDYNESLVASLMAQGSKQFREGDYGRAARSFLLAAQMDQGDPASRLQAAHALCALGHYDEAFLLIRRAFQLQPKLAYLELDVRREYEDPTTFQKHVQALKEKAVTAGDDSHLWALLGYYRFFSDERELAYQALEHAVGLDPDNKLAARLFEVARLSVPASVSTK